MSREIFLLSIAIGFAVAPCAQAQIIYTINDGSFNSSTGAFSRSGTDPFQGIGVSFSPVDLGTVGTSVQVSFNLVGGGGNNSPQQLALGLFSGGALSADAETSVTDAWEGYFHALGARSSNGGVSFGVYRQGGGPATLMNRESNWTTTIAQVDGSGGSITTGHRAAYNQNGAAFTVTLERLSATELRLTSTFTTARVDGSHSGTVDGVAWTNSSNNGTGTVTSTYTLGGSDPTLINGFALAGTQNFTLTDLNISVIPEPSSAVLVGFGLVSLLGARRRLA